MRILLPLLLAASAFPFPASAQKVPVKVPVAVTPDEAPLPAGESTWTGSELEGVRASEAGLLSQGKYETGTVGFKPARVTTYVNRQEVVIVQSKQRFGIPVKAVKAVWFGNGSPARVAAGTGNAGLAAGVKTQSGSPTLVAIEWVGAATKGGVVLRLDKGDFDSFLSALQTVTGVKAASAEEKAGK